MINGPNGNSETGFIKSIPSFSVKKTIIFLYILNIVVRLYGIWFPRWAWDEPYYFSGGINIITFFSGLIKGEWRSDQIPEFFNVVGIVNKYICLIPALLGFLFEKIFHLQTTLPIGAYFSRFFLGFLPNILIVVYIQKIILLIWKSDFLLICNLVLFLFPYRLIETSIYGVADSLVTFLAVASIYYLIKIMQTGDGELRLKYIRMNALFVCFAVSTKMNVGVICGLVFFIVLFYDHYVKKNSSISLINSLKNYILIFVALFIIINLPYLFHFQTWIDSVLYHANGGYKFLIRGHPLAYFFMIPAMGIGWGLLIVSLAGLVFCLFQPIRKTLFPVFIFMLLYYVFLSSTYGSTHNWQIPLIPFLVLFASFFLYSIYLKLTHHVKQPISLMLTILVLILVSAVPFKHILEFKMNLTEKPETLEILRIKLQDIPQDELVFLRDEKIKSLSDLQNKNFIVFTNDWFAIESHPYPKFLLRYENFQKRTSNTDWLLIRKYVEQNWKLYSVIQPKHFTSWTNNTSVNASYFIYKK
jgi:hypothetical protein